MTKESPLSPTQYTRRNKFIAKTSSISQAPRFTWGRPQSQCQLSMITDVKLQTCSSPTVYGCVSGCPADSLPWLNGPRSSSCQVSRLPFVLNVATSVRHSSLVCLSNSTLFSGSVGCVHKWHHNDNYNNYVSIQQQLCGIVSASSTLHNCQDGLIAAQKTSWAIIHHPPRFFSLPDEKATCLSGALFFFLTWWCEEKKQK